MIGTLWLIAVLVGSVLLVAILCARFGRPIPPRLVLAFAVLPLLVLAPAFQPGRTILPAHDISNFQPWASSARFKKANPYLIDSITEFAPWHEAVRRAYRAGSLPLWNRWNGCGMPLAANAQSAAFSPLTFVMFLLPLGSAFTWLAAFKIFLAGSGTWLWLTELGVGSEAACFGAVSFALCFSMTTVLLLPMSTVFCFWPWGLFLIECQRDEMLGRKRLLGLLSWFAILVLLGHPESVALGIVFAGLWLILRRLAGGLPDFRKVLGRTVLSGIVAAGLSAFSLLPFASALKASNRSALTSSFVTTLKFQWHRPLFPVAAVTSIFPRALGDGFQIKALPQALAGFPDMTLGYFGVVGLAAALMGFAGDRRARPERIALMILAATGVWIGAIAWPFADLHDLLPILRLVAPLRFLGWTALAGSGLAAFGLDIWLDRAARRRSAPWIPATSAAFVGAAFVAIFALLYGAHAVTGSQGAFTSEFLRDMVALGLFALLAMLFCRSTNSRRARVVAWLFPALAALQLSVAISGYYVAQDAGDLYPPGRLTSFLAAQPGLFRTVGRGAAMFQHTNIFAGVEDIRTRDPMERRDYVDFLDQGAGYPPDSDFKMLRNFNAPILNDLNVRFLVSSTGQQPPGPRWRAVYSGDDGVVYENEDARQRVFATRDSEHLSISRMMETTNSLFFDASVSGGRPIEVEISTVQDGGWSARNLSSGKPLEVTRKSGSPLISMTIPPGRSNIKLRYLPPGFRLGSAISLATIVVLCISAAVVLIARQSTAKDGVASTPRPVPVSRKLR